MKIISVFYTVLVFIKKILLYTNKAHGSVYMKKKAISAVYLPIQPNWENIMINSIAAKKRSSQIVHLFLFSVMVWLYS